MTKLVFVKAPQLTERSKTYPADYEYTYDRSEYRGIEILRVYVNGKPSSMGKFLVNLPQAPMHYDSIKACINYVNRWVK